MEQPKNLGQARETSTSALLPVSVIGAARNEARNLPRCLEALRGLQKCSSSIRRAPMRRSKWRVITAHRWSSSTITELAEETAVGDRHPVSGQRMDSTARCRRGDDTGTGKRGSSGDPESRLRRLLHLSATIFPWSAAKAQ